MFTLSMVEGGLVGLTAPFSTWDLSPQSVIEPVPPALGPWSLYHWATRVVPQWGVFEQESDRILVNSKKLLWLFCKEFIIERESKAERPQLAGCCCSSGER